MSASNDHPDRPSILLVEDNPGDVRLIRTMLREIDWQGHVFAADRPPEVVAVERLEEAIAELDASTRLVLLDLKLPDSTGLATVDRMAGAVDGQPIVVLTGLQDESVGLEAIQRGAQDYLVKDDAGPRTLQRTIRYAIERERQQRELRRRNEKLAVLTWVLRHDIRDEMSIVVGRGRSLERYVDQSGRPYLDEVVEAGENVIGLTDTVREFLEVLEEDRRPGDESVGLAPTLEAEIETARANYEHASFDLDGAIPDVEVAGSELLGSVFKNLLQNAVRHHDGDDPSVRIAATADEETATVEVADDGPGIAPERRETIFGEAERGAGSPGTGVGLYLVDTIVDIYGGSVAVTDNPGAESGSLFRVTLSRA